MNRYTCRDFLNNQISQDDLEVITKAALASPSSMHREPWQIITVTNKELINELEDAGLEVLKEDPTKKVFYDNITKRGGKLFYNAPAIIYVSVAKNSLHGRLDSSARDCGIVCQNIALAATSLGYGSCICGLAALPLTGEKENYFKEKLQFKDDYEFGIAVLIGEANVKNAPLPKPHEIDLDKLIYID